MAAQDNNNKETNSMEMGEKHNEKECGACLASQREAELEELHAEGPARYKYYVTKEEALKHLTGIIVSAIDSMGRTIEVQDGLMAELEAEKNGLKFSIVAARAEMSKIKEKLKGRRLSYRKSLRRNTFIQSLLNEEKCLLAELAEKKKKNSSK